MGRERKVLGNLGEALASEAIIKKGYRIIAKNERTPFGEIDIIAKHGRSIVFVEVKTRLTSSLGPAYLSVTRTKMRHIVKNALYYLVRRGLTNTLWRIDVVSIKLDSKYSIEEFEIIENAVQGENL